MIQAERNRIAAEMHDDLGSGLTKIKYLSDGLYLAIKDEKSQYDLKKIAEFSNTLVTDMGEIVWALNSRFDNLQGLKGYIRRYAAEFLEDCGFEHEIHANLDFSKCNRR